MDRLDPSKLVLAETVRTRSRFLHTTTGTHHLTTDLVVRHQSFCGAPLQLALIPLRHIRPGGSDPRQCSIVSTSAYPGHLALRDRLEWQD